MNLDNETFKTTAEKANTFRYLVTHFNKEGWAEAKASKPIPFDLVTVETETGKKIAAWWNEFSWEGLRLKKSDEVLRWKRRKYEHIT